MENNQLADKVIPYSGKFLRVKIFTDFAILQPPAKVFSKNFRHATPIYNIL